MSPHDPAHRDLDSISLLMLGGFFFSMGLLVLLGTFWALSRPAAALVNACAGFLLLFTGIAMLAIGRRLRRRAQSPAANALQSKSVEQQDGP